VVAGACVAVLAASPGNCLAIWGLIDAEALMPLVDPLAVPVADRHALLGFTLYGALSDGTAPDPELVDLLGQLGSAAAAASAYVEARAARSRLADVEKILSAGVSLGSTTAVG